VRCPGRKLALLAVGSVLLTSCGDDGPAFGAPRGATEQGRDIFRLWQGSIWAALAVGAFVWGLIAYCVIRFRRRSDELPAQTHANVPLEIAYTITPLVIVAVLFAVNLRTLDRVDHLGKNPGLTVEVTAFQWQWRFHYVESDIEIVGTDDVDPVMMLPAGETVRLVLTSNDVQHSFFVPAFLFKRDTVPGITNEVDLEVEKEGRYDGRCAEFCGLFHDRMGFVVEAVGRAEYDRWVTEQRTLAANARAGAFTP
jgi:cytochrome c oxidase subunit 2